MAGKRTPRVGEVWTCGEGTRTLLATADGYWLVKDQNGEVFAIGGEYIVSQYSPPKPPLPDVPETVWVNVHPTYVERRAFPTRDDAEDDACSQCIAVAEYRLVEVHGR